MGSCPHCGASARPTKTGPPALPIHLANCGRPPVAIVIGGRTYN